MRTKAIVRCKVWWPNINEEVETMISLCSKCICQGEPEKPEPVKPTDWVNKPWSSVAIDICGPFVTGEYLVVLVDYFSKWPEAMLTKSTKSIVIQNWLEEVFSAHGYPDILTSDNGPQFVSADFKQFLKDRGIVHRKVTPYWPQAKLKG